MEPAFRDPAVEPTAARIDAVLGSAAEAWDALVGLIDTAGLTLAWRYYRDGGWLAKAARGTRTVAWLSVAAGHARVTCYFTEADRPRLVASTDLPASLRDRIATSALIGKLLPVSVDVRIVADVRDAEAVMQLKLGTPARRH